MIWGRGQEAWVDSASWLRGAGAQFALRSNNRQTNSAASTTTAGAEVWHYAKDGEAKGPMGRAQLIRELQLLSDREGVLLWTKGYKSWEEIYAFPDIAKELGVERRHSPRADINCLVMLTMEGGGKLAGRIVSIGPEGARVTGLPDRLSVGQIVSLDFQHEELGQPISAKAQVQSVANDGAIGLQFTSISMEAKSQILKFVRERASGNRQAA
jgi:hypothetical protein